MRFIILPPGLALCRRSRLNSNVRPHESRHSCFPQQLHAATPTRRNCSGRGSSRIHCLGSSPKQRVARSMHEHLHRGLRARQGEAAVLHVVWVWCANLQDYAQVQGSTLGVGGLWRKRGLHRRHSEGLRSVGFSKQSISSKPRYPVRLGGGRQ